MTAGPQFTKMWQEAHTKLAGGGGVCSGSLLQDIAFSSCGTEA